MLFDQVTKEHILLGIKDYQAKGLPNGFGPSSTYDLVYEGKRYPPKAVMVYANYHAIGRKIENYFEGGGNSDCFKAFEINEFKLIKKSKKIMNEKLYNLKNDFLKEWPIERLKTMTLEEYTNLEKSSFCYWLEAITTDLGSIWGGSAYKFGVFKRKDLESENYNDKRMSDGEYSWYGKYGNTKEIVFSKIKNLILDIANSSKENNLAKIDDIDLGDAYKWKIAFLYGNFNIINIFKIDSLRRISMGLGLNTDDSFTMSQLNKLILNQKSEEEDFFTYSNRIWEAFGKESEIAKKFEKWLKTNENGGSKKASSYLRAIEILINHFKVKIYEEDDLSTLNSLYLDLKKHQTNPNGKYFYPKAKSYGINRFYSAAVKAYIDFLNDSSETTSKPSVLSESSTNYIKKNPIINSPSLNTILFGPPGTGKTFNTVNRALEICGESIDGLNRKEIKELYDLKVSEGQIIFTTFHQSMSYEDFIEGIKPIEPEKEGDPVIYKVIEGIFKKACIEASFNFAIDNNDTDTDKVLDFSLAYDNFIQKLEERLASETEVELEIKNGGKVYVDSISQQGNIQIKHLEGLRTYTVSKTRLSKLQKAITNLDEISNINDSFRAIIGGSNSTAYWSVLNAIQKENHFDNNLNNIQRKYSPEEKREAVKELDKNIYKGNTGKPIVLIIDEINRGNVSAIFGELITLIEKDKRLGADEALLAQLPYSKETFGVPPNLYIIGTMNTADRSVEALDSALRRRFSFTEMPPKPKLIKEVGSADNGVVEDINLVKILKTINNRIEKLLDRDHAIGHSYFLKVKNLKQLKAVFANKVIPLLQEYFFGDYGKIGLVLGSGFVKSIQNDNEDGFFASFEDYDLGTLLERKIYRIKDATEMNNEDFKKAILKLIG
ncbi:McrB family protein [Maribacter litoralis]|uniref:AAA+ ATPase domain-containing protein n=1 Tax=Maribacter litoralis TaxID=2059726 RepID=A0A653WNC3_9FLAO|nr:AAA family ATPase [Maribacter litoralis]VXC15539.1 conserved hypothetical protein [Maribacter litoralis]